MRKTIELINYDFQGDLFIDVGGNVGMWTKQLYDEYNNFIFIEPSYSAIEQAKNNIKDERNKVLFLKNICSDVENTKKSIFSSTADTGNFSVFGKELYGDTKMSEEDIETITINQLLNNNIVKESKDILIKIDTEGSDLDILLGAFNFIKNKKPTIIVEAHFHMYFDQNKYDKIFSFLKENGYNITTYKNTNYLNQANVVFDGKHNGTQMYDMHYQMLIEPTNI